MHAIIRRYAPEAAEGHANECYANLTGLRTFFKMTYNELAGNILRDMKREIGITFSARVTTLKAFEHAKQNGRKEKSFSTYRELNGRFAAKPYTVNRGMYGTKKLVVPFLGKVN